MVYYLFCVYWQRVDKFYYYVLECYVKLELIAIMYLFANSVFSFDICRLIRGYG